MKRQTRKSTFQVLNKPCSQCLFSKNKIVSDARRAEILRACQRDDAHFICHKTKNVCCRGFFDRYSTNLIRIASRLNVLEFVDERDAPNPYASLAEDEPK